MSSSRVTIKSRSGKTPNKSANKTDISTTSPAFKSNNVNRFDVTSLNFKEKLELLDKHEGTEDESDVLMSLICSDDLNEDYIEEPKRRTKPHESGIAKNLQSQFELESDSYAVYTEKDGEQGIGVNNNEDDFGLKGVEVPEIIQQVVKGIKALDEWSKAFAQLQEAEIENEMKKGTSKLDEMINTMEAKVIPALQKVLKDPARFNELSRREPPQKGISCKLEDQKKLIESLTSISEVCFQLRNLKFSSKEIEGKCDTLEQLANYVDSNLDGQGAEKLKFKNLEKFLYETVSSYKKDEE